MTSHTDNSDTPLPNLELEFLQEGDRGPLVAQLQSRLALFDYYAGDITGHFDSSTKAALQALQYQHQLIEDGYFGPETWYAITFWMYETQFHSVQQMWDNCMTWIKEIVFQRQRFRHPASFKTSR